MSRSYKKSPVIPNAVTNKSNKKNKQAANQKMRSRNNQRLKELALNYEEGDEYDEEGLVSDMREVSEIYDFYGDGKTWLTKDQAEENNGKYLRK
jgi:hypothetical protein